MRERIILETLKNSSGYLNIDYFADKLGYLLELSEMK